MIDDELGFRSDHAKRSRSIWVLLGLLAASIIVSLMMGNYSVPLDEVINSLVSHLSGGGDGSSYDIVVWEIRLPRILAAGAVGAALAVAGCTLQGIFRNPLVEPYVLGVSSGAAFGAALSIVVGFSLVSMQITAIFFALLATAMAYSIATVGGEARLVNLLLSGLVVTSLFVSGLSYLKTIALPGQLQEITFWLMGGFYNLSWKDTVFLVPAVLIMSLAIYSLSNRMNTLSLGEETARTLGVNVRALKLILIVVATVLTSVAVSLVGIIAWVGILMPHLARMILGADHRYLIPGSALMAASFLIICDTLARTLTAGEIPITILTSFIGAPILIALIRRKKAYSFGGS